MRVKKACQCWAATLLLTIAGAMGGQAAVLDGSYISIDVSGGPAATNYPLTYYQTLADVPGGPNSVAYKTTNILLRLIPNGTFIMGSPTNEPNRDVVLEAQHQVTLTKDFFMGVFEVTQRQWELVMGYRPSYCTNSDYYAGRPVETVSYYEIRENPLPEIVGDGYFDKGSAIYPHWPVSAQAYKDSFVGKLRSKTGLTTLDLPTEAQWEYACRAGTTTPLNSGKEWSVANLSEVGRYWGNCGGDWSQASAPSNGGSAVVGSYLPNAWGLYDMHGNVDEWCLDLAGVTGTVAVVDPVGAVYNDDDTLGNSNQRSSRGYNWNGQFYARADRSAARGADTPTEARSWIGFRLARTVLLQCELTAPANASVVKAGTNVSLSAAAYLLDFEGRLSKAEYFANGAKIGEVAAEPFSFEWQNVPVGVYDLTVVATDSRGQTGVSSVVTIFVTTSGDWECWASGGTVTNYTQNGTNYEAHVFTNVGTNSLTVLGGGGFEVLVVGGGGGGGAGRCTSGGGGGAGDGGDAGGVVHVPRCSVAAGTHTFVVGGGGGGACADKYNSTPGANSTAFGVIAAGSARGGGGAGAAGATTPGGDGGVGITNAILGVNYCWGGGGAGAAHGSRGGSGGLGGGGGGASCDTAGGGNGGVGALNAGGIGGVGTNANGGAGGANTGGGGGGGVGSGVGGSGGSGIVIVRYIVGINSSPTSTFSVVYDGNGANDGIAPAPLVKTQYVDVVVAGNTGSLVRSGYIFAGWNTATNGAGTDYLPGAIYEANASVRLYAKWVVNAPPMISAHPASIAVYEGQTGSFNVDALGSEPLSYQWYANNAAISGATGTSYTTPGTTTNDNGMQFKVTVNNAYGTVTSSVATLTVIPATLLTLAAGSGGAVQPDGAVVVTQGAAVGIAAIAAEGYVFTAWKVMSGAATFADIQAATTTVAITAPATIQAYFAPINPPSGTVWSWGQNTYGQLGDGTNINRVLPVQTIGLSNVTAMAAPSAGGSTFGLSSNGTVWAWGYNYYGQLGDGTKTNRPSPTQVRLTDGAPLSNVVAMAAAVYSTYALHSNSTIWAWGANNYGQLGDGTKTNRTSPTQVILPDGAPLSNVVAIAAAGDSAYALHSNSTIWAWGYNNIGQLGDGTKTNRTFATQVRLPDGVPLSNVVAIVAGSTGGGYDTTYALKRDGSLHAWGNSTFGQLGDGTNINRSTPVQVSGLSNITAVACSGYTTYALHTNGTLWACGLGSQGQLGDGTNITRSTFVQVTGLSNITAIACSTLSAFAVHNSGAAWAWGYNGSGQLGDGTTGSRRVPTPVRMSDGSQLSNVASIVTSGGATYALMRDGRLCSWGDNSSGQLGDGTTSNRLNPVQVKSIDGTTSISGVARVCANGNGVLVIRNLTARGGNVSELAGAAAPTGLTATASATNWIELAWTDSATNETGYVVDRSTDSNAWESVTMTSANATNASDTGLTTNTLYYYRVAATNAAGLSAYCCASARTWTVYEAWLRSHFGGADLNNLSVSGATADPDHDGLNNEQEYWAGTDPNSASSCLTMYAVTNALAAAGEFLVRWQSATGRLYTVQAATNLVVGFSNLVRHLPATPPVNVHTDNVSGAGCRFYRVQVE